MSVMPDEDEVPVFSQKLSDAEIITTMEKCGGAFIQALAGAARKADLNNLRRLKKAFPDYWATYQDIALQIARANVERSR